MAKRSRNSTSGKSPPSKRRKQSEVKAQNELKADPKEIVSNQESKIRDGSHSILNQLELRELLKSFLSEPLSTNETSLKFNAIKINWDKIKKEKSLHEYLPQIKWWVTNEMSNFFKDEIAQKFSFNYRQWKDLASFIHKHNLDLLSDLTLINSNDSFEEAGKSINRIHIVLRAINESISQFHTIFIEIVNLTYPKIIHKPFQVHLLYMKNLLYMTYLEPSHYARLVCAILPHIMQDYNSKMNLNLNPHLNLNLDPPLILKQNFISLFNEILTSVSDFIKTKSAEITRVGLQLYDEFKIAAGKCTEDIILPNFIIFYISSLDGILRKTLLDDQWEIISNTHSPNKRDHVYLITSLIVHATFVSKEEIWHCMDLFSMWLHSYLNKLDLKVAEPNIKKHALFYEIFHGMMFIFINHYKELFQHNKGRYFIEGLGIKRIINSRLNPLLVCDPKLCHYFSELTFFFEFAQCRMIINSNVTLRKKPKYAKTSFSIPFNDTFFVPETQNSCDGDNPLPVLSSQIISPIYQKAQDLNQPIDFEELEEYVIQSVKPLE